MDALKIAYQPSFRAQISHELRIPITKIMGAVSLLGDTALTCEQQAHLNCIQTCAEHLLMMQIKIDQLFLAQKQREPQPHEP